MTKAAHCILFEKILKLGQKKMHLMLHKQHGDYNTKTSIYISNINPFCIEDEIVEELNIVLKEHRIKKAEEEKS